MNIQDDEFEEEFQTFGHTLDAPVLDKLRELCQLYRLDASGIALQWVAYSHTNSNCPLNMENLEGMERQRLSRKGHKPSQTPRSSKKPAGPAIYDIKTLESVLNNDADDILDAYSTPSGKTPNKRQQTTPDNSVAKRAVGMGRSPAVPFSPASLSPAVSTPSGKYSSRANKGDVVCTFGPAEKKVVWKTKRTDSAVIEPYDSETHLNKRFKYMFQKLSDKAMVLNDLIEHMAAKLQKQHNIEEFGHVAIPVQDQMTVVGRIACDSNGKLNAKSVVLEGSRETSAGNIIPLDVSELRQYSVFPGQIVALDGLNSTGNKFVSKKIYEGIPLPLPEKKPDLIEVGGLRVVVACGPYTTSDSLMYEPLADFIRHVQRECPDICIMLGPFIDAKNPEIEKGNLDATFEDFFERTVDQITAAMQKLPTKLVFVPSLRDAHHDNVYPQPPFFKNKDNEKVHFVSDPCTISMDGVIFGITATDILFHLGAEEISFPPGSSDRLARLTHHILSQQNYYPLYPPHEDMSIDYEQYEIYARMPVMPHVLIVPSDLRYFVKDVAGCCCVNPGRLTKGQVGGTFARMYIAPPTGQNVNKPLTNSINAEILRI